MIVAVATQKGGSAKTTTVVNLGAALGAAGHRTLVVDLDGQGHASHWLRGADGRHRGPFVQDWLEGRAAAADVVRPTRWPHLDVVPTNLALNGLRDRLEATQRADGRRLLADHLRALRDRYAWVLLDCPAGLNALAINALVAAEGVLIPVAPPEPLAVDGAFHLLQTVERIAQATPPGPSVLGVLVANTQPRRAAERRHVDRLRTRGLPVFASQIPASARVATAAAAHRPLIAHAPGSPAAVAYHALAAELAALTGRNAA
ncbi:MAG TPA: ParA family protein [Chloroflexota bacterium]|jgi:chromosome partitioning protein